MWRHWCIVLGYSNLGMHIGICDLVPAWDGCPSRSTLSKAPFSTRTERSHTSEVRRVTHTTTMQWTTALSNGQRLVSTRGGKVCLLWVKVEVTVTPCCIVNCQISHDWVTGYSNDILIQVWNYSNPMLEYDWTVAFREWYELSDSPGLSTRA